MRSQPRLSPLACRRGGSTHRRSPASRGEPPRREVRRAGVSLDSVSGQLYSFVQPSPWGTREGTGELFLGLHQRACIFLRAMTPDPVVCPSRAKDGAPRCALESFSRRIPMSAHIAAVSLLVVLLSVLGCFVRAPGMATLSLRAFPHR